ncbi:MAG: FKBP-type peptidyl-prolyl cis-trans isomerase, partial [Candidatus Electrothrix sp. AUS4]|nr:FKBP-type peptidyl-prolyl cis-trans isomerase [Candidatus Electrothrix sp. AUS4]
FWGKVAIEQPVGAQQYAEGVKVTASGLQYKVMTGGKGDKPSATDTVKVHYKGTLLDGTEFDSSYKRNEPASFRVDQVIPGWTEALQLMAPGSKYMLYLPPELAYGDRGAPPAIEPGSLLIFEVELIEIVKGGDK